MTRNATVMKARELRRTMTLPEGLLWQLLRRRPGGFKFRRQHPLGPFILDFYCAARRLAVEIDGECHSLGDRPERDARRDAYLRHEGVRVVRFDAADVLHHMDAVVRTILAEASVEPPLPQPSPSATAGPPPHRQRWGGTELARPTLHP